MIRLAIRVAAEQAELVLAELLELAPGGVEEVHPDSATVEYAVYGAPGELPSLPDIEAVAGPARIEVSTSELPDDWHERWKDFHKPVLIEAPSQAVAALRIRPPWEPATAASAAKASPLHEIVIDPGQAFGTGGHASTRLCLGLLLDLLAAGHVPGPLLDVGTGSGVLAIAAGLLGFGPLLGLDHERESVAAASENASANGVELDTRLFDLRSEELPWLGRPDGPREPVVLMANLLRGLLLVLARAIERPPAHLIAGGLLREELDEVAGVFAERHGLHERARRESGDWGALWLTATG